MDNLAREAAHSMDKVVHSTDKVPVRVVRVYHSTDKVPVNPDKAHHSMVPPDKVVRVRSMDKAPHTADRDHNMDKALVRVE